MPRTLQPHLVHAYVNHIAIDGLNWSIFRKQRNRAWRIFAIFQYLYRAPPGFSLAVVDLAQIENMPLHHTPVAEAMVLDDAPVAVFFAVLDSPSHPKEHAAIVFKSRTGARG